jgi:electron transfer flavoprotein beta subunit
LVTVNGSADECRPRNTKMVQRNKYAKTPSEKASLTDVSLYEKRPYLNLGEWSAADVDADLSQTGLAGSPTKVKQVENVVFQAKESKRLTTADEEIDELMKELITNHTIG